MRPDFRLFVSALLVSILGGSGSVTGSALGGVFVTLTLKVIEFAQLFSPGEGVAKLVVTFLAILELAREALIEVTQQVSYSPIYIKSKHGLTVV